MKMANYKLLIKPTNILDLLSPAHRRLTESALKLKDKTVILLNHHIPGLQIQWSREQQTNFQQVQLFTHPITNSSRVTINIFAQEQISSVQEGFKGWLHKPKPTLVSMTGKNITVTRNFINTPTQFKYWYQKGTEDY